MVFWDTLYTVAFLILNASLSLTLMKHHIHENMHQWFAMLFRSHPHFDLSLVNDFLTNIPDGVFARDDWVVDFLRNLMHPTMQILIGLKYIYLWWNNSICPSRIGLDLVENGNIQVQSQIGTFPYFDCAQRFLHLRKIEKRFHDTNSFY